MSAEPVDFTPYDWRDFESGGTAISAPHLLAMQLKVASYAADLAESNTATDVATNPGDAITVGQTAVNVFDANENRIAAGFTNWHPTATVWVSRTGTAQLDRGQPVPPFERWRTTSKSAISIISDTDDTRIPRWEE
jgi:hypothetical protein